MNRLDIEDEELSSLIHNFTKRYSSIATERLLNYHLGKNRNIYLLN